MGPPSENSNAQSLPYPRQAQQRRAAWKNKRKHVEKISASLGIISALIGGGLLSVLLSPQWAAFDSNKANGYCQTRNFAGEGAGPSSCEDWRQTFWISATLSFAFTVMTLFLTFAAVYGFEVVLPAAFLSFWLSLVAVALAMISTSWMVYNAIAAVTATAVMAVLVILTLVLVLPAIRWSHDLFATSHRIDTFPIVWNQDDTSVSTSEMKKKTAEEVRSQLDYKKKTLRGGELIHVAVSKAISSETQWTKVKPNIATAWIKRVWYWANYTYYKNLLKLLVASGTDPDQLFHRDEVSAILLVFQTPPSVPISYTMARTLLRAGVDANSVDRNGLPLLGKAVRRSINHSSHAFDVVQLLLDFGADPDKAYDENGDSALHEAVRLDHPSVVETLLKNDANVDVQNDAGATPLHLAAEHGRDACAKELLAKKASAAVLDESGSSVLHCAVGKRALTSSSSSRKIVVQLLQAPTIANSINLFNNCGLAPLHLAIEQGDADMVECLCRGNGIGIKADVNLADIKGRTPLTMAADYPADWILAGRPSSGGTNKDNPEVLAAKMIATLMRYGADTTMQASAVGARAEARLPQELEVHEQPAAKLMQDGGAGAKSSAFRIVIE